MVDLSNLSVDFRIQLLDLGDQIPSFGYDPVHSSLEYIIDFGEALVVLGQSVLVSFDFLVKRAHTDKNFCGIVGETQVVVADSDFLP